MTRFSSTPARAALAFCLGLLLAAPLPAQAQSLRDNPQPAELPPESFQGNQYVDSAGCVFIRAGIDGATRWVPRVARNREVICGFQPTQVAGTVPVPPGGQQAPDVVQIVPAGPAEPAVAEARTVAQTGTAAPAPTRSLPQTARVPAAAAAPRSTEPARIVVVQAPPLVPRAVDTPARSAEPVRLVEPAQRMVRPNGTTRRVPPRRVVIHPGPSGHTLVTPQTRLAPKIVHETRPAPPRVIPPGYRPAFDEDRFNPHRGHQTLAGRQEMALVWTNTVPRHLVDQRTGQRVTHHYPGLHYPDVPGQPVKAKPATPKAAPAVTSTRSAPQPAPAATASHRYVQVGVFRPDGAQVAVERLHGAGLPLRIRSFTHKGDRVKMVLAGPFSEQSRLTEALAVSQRLGFPGAKLRKE